jgi:hypothetical protein
MWPKVSSQLPRSSNHLRSGVESAENLIMFLGVIDGEHIIGDSARIRSVKLGLVFEGMPLGALTKGELLMAQLRTHN